MDKLWAGGFEKDTEPIVEAFTESVSFDRRLYREDIRGSIAHAEMLCSSGLIAESELIEIRQGLLEIEQEIESGTFEVDQGHEDIHMNIEAALIRRIGEAGRRLHTGRSRNDQVACDLRLWTRRAIEETDGLLARLQSALVDRAEAFKDLVMPGFTHLQHAQPVLLAHVLLAYVEMLQRDRDRVLDCLKRTNVSPLGACAMAGTALPVDVEMTAEQLGFDRPFSNSIDAVSDRDFVVEFVFAGSLVMCHLSRLCEEWLLWASQEFDFIDMDESFCTGSSIMPQKKNPDVLELARGKSARVIGHLMALLTLLKGLPLAYNRDFQEDKPALFDATDQVQACLGVLAELVARTTFKEDRAREACERGHMDATSLADYLVGRGLPFREAHEVVGAAVRQAAVQNAKLSELTLLELRRFSELIGEDVFRVLGVRNCVENYRSHGSSSPAEVERQLRHWRDALGSGDRAG
ncbi:MAG: argininosuccinate lyase [Candidatus Brocadiia bacterium]|jgi:argininosuccinate lyase|nr:argininosuccinate lyase [Candidatus Brocadiia bacterium]